ncbi:geranylgeranyl transferase type-2 subunit beta [Pancytospora philotis]|nr:geranylgeranyl transferase type-2 subunit beta [Pancytospora philotis]
MIAKELHAQFIRDMMESRDVLYHLTNPQRISTLYWAVNSLKLLGDGQFQAMRSSVLEFVASCQNSDGGFGGNEGYPSSAVTTFNALQLLYLYDVPYWSPGTAAYLAGLQQKGGWFGNDEFLEQDTRVDCCAVLSLHFLSLMKGAYEEQYPGAEPPANIGQLAEKTHRKLCSEGLRQPVDSAFLEELGVDRNAAIDYLLSCYNADGGFGQLPGAESHAAQVFCCLSALRSLGALELADAESIEDFLVFRQHGNGGIEGRPHKKEDVCYSFWGLASLKILGRVTIDLDGLRSFSLSCQGSRGGFSDRKGNECDLYHLMFALCSLSLIGGDGLEPIDPGFAL